MAVSDNLVLRGKVTAISALVSALTGEAPEVEYAEDHVSIKFSEKQKPILQDIFYRSMTARPGEIRVDWNSVVLPATFRAYGKYAIMLLIISFLLGKATD